MAFLLHACFALGGIVENIVLAGYYVPVWGQARHERRSLEYYEQKLGLLRRLIDSELAR